MVHNLSLLVCVFQFFFKFLDASEVSESEAPKNRCGWYGACAFLFLRYSQDRRYIRATASICRFGCARIIVGVSVDNTYIQRIVRSWLPCFSIWRHSDPVVFLTEWVKMLTCALVEFLKTLSPRALGRHRFSLTIHEVSGNRTRDVVNHRPGAQFSSSLEIRSSARDVRMVESNETENWYSRVRSTWRSNDISYTTCMQYCQVALFTYKPINSLV